VERARHIIGNSEQTGAAYDDYQFGEAAEAIALAQVHATLAVEAQLRRIADYLGMDPRP
jgi:hypothetical protein